VISERGEKENDKGAEREISGERRCGKEKVVKVKKKRKDLRPLCFLFFNLFVFQNKTCVVLLCEAKNRVSQKISRIYFNCFCGPR